ncbi:hypothetical protein DFH07DRAFT_1059264, partial [Mycena maculata]
MSVKELQTRLEKISADIDLQKEVLRKLEHSKSLVQGQLNAICDPMARLPLEIWPEIFLGCLPLLPEPGAHDAPMLLLNICHKWTDITLATPALWAAIHVPFRRGDGFKEV